MSWRKYRSTRHLYTRQRTSLGVVVDEALRRTPGSERAAVRVHARGTALLADPAALAEALGNLLQNALKYDPDGPVELTARRVQRMIVFTVTDRGPGLPPGPPDQIFEAFFRYVAADRPDPGGSGLGLAVARQIVRAHGGKLVARRRRGPGLSLIVVLPAGAAA